MIVDVAALAEWAVAGGSIVGAVGWIVRAITRDVARDTADLAHRVKNQASRIDALEHHRTSDIERVVKLEAAVQSFDRAIERVERGQEKLSDTLNDRFDMLAESIREIRNVSPKS